MSQEPESWDKYQKLILEELRSLNAGQERMSDELITLHKDVEALAPTKEFVDKIRDVATVTQYEKLYENVTTLMRFRYATLVLIGGVQALFGFMLWYLTYSK
jgi:hypothetical protein|tara:strand:- start:623 stop:928 length:306 start_codon:yes stop_codon:yes gene_type:complete